MVDLQGVDWLSLLRTNAKYAAAMCAFAAIAVRKTTGEILPNACGPGPYTVFNTCASAVIPVANEWTKLYLGLAVVFAVVVVAVGVYENGLPEGVE